MLNLCSVTARIEPSVCYTPETRCVGGLVLSLIRTLRHLPMGLSWCSASSTGGGLELSERGSLAAGNRQRAVHASLAMATAPIVLV